MGILTHGKITGLGEAHYECYKIKIKLVTTSVFMFSVVCKLYFKERRYKNLRLSQQLKINMLCQINCISRNEDTKIYCKYSGSS
jgi:hypothetical protein